MNLVAITELDYESKNGMTRKRHQTHGTIMITRFKMFVLNLS